MPFDPHHQTLHTARRTEEVRRAHPLGEAFLRIQTIQMQHHRGFFCLCISIRGKSRRHVLRQVLPVIEVRALPALNSAVLEIYIGT